MQLLKGVFKKSTLPNCSLPLTSTLVLTVMYGLLGLELALNTGMAYGASGQQEILIGLRANRGKAKAIKRWQPTANYLSQQFPEYTFRFVLFEINSSLNQAVSRDEFDFVLTNPAGYVEMNIRYDTTGLVTLVNKRLGKGYSEFGSVIFTRAEREDIQSFSDLKGKSFMGADELGFGGWRVAWHEMLQHGIDPYRDFSELKFGGGIQQNVIHAVRDRQVDAGSVRTDMLERMAQAGEIRLEDYKVIGAKTSGQFPFLRSTQLYPEWPLAKLRYTDHMLAQRLAQALLAIPPDHPAAVKGKYIGWKPVLDYQPVDDLLKELAAGPYSRQNKVTFAQIVHKYWPWILLAVSIIAFILIMLMRLKVLNSRLLVTEQQLTQTNQALRDMTRMALS